MGIAAAVAAATVAATVATPPQHHTHPSHHCASVCLIAETAECSATTADTVARTAAIGPDGIHAAAAGATGAACMSRWVGAVARRDRPRKSEWQWVGWAGAGAREPHGAPLAAVSGPPRLGGGRAVMGGHGCAAGTAGTGPWAAWCVRTCAFLSHP